MAPRPINAIDPPVGSHLPLAHGWDTIVEVYDLFPSQRLQEALDAGKRHAQAQGNIRVEFSLDGELFHLSPTGLRGWSWVLEDDLGRFSIHMRANAPDYGVKVEYRSAALWCCPDALDWSDLQSEVYEILGATCSPRDGAGKPPKINRADYAFDFYAPEFTHEMAYPETQRLFSTHGKVKRNFKLEWSVHGRGDHVETFTLGNKSSLQTSVYNKALEITEVSGKDWMLDIHRMNATEHGLAIYPPGMKASDIWRLEFRIGKDRLKRRFFDNGSGKRSARVRDVFIENARDILDDAMRSHRLKNRPHSNEDSDKRRWPDHWFWGVAAHVVSGDSLRAKVAHLATGRRDALVEMNRKAIYGSLRSLAILQKGDCEQSTLEELLTKAGKEITADPEHRLKIQRAESRYALVDRPH